MSSFIRRIERTQHESKKCHSFEKEDPTTTGKVVWYSNPPRHVHYKHRGSKLGFHNPEAKDLLARQAREARRVAIS